MLIVFIILSVFVLVIIVHFSSKSRKPIGELHVVLGLEDLGPLPPEVLEGNQNASEVTEIRVLRPVQMSNLSCAESNGNE